MIRHRGPPSQTWRTFLRNHADAIAAIDLCVVPTMTFECLFEFFVVGHGRRQLLWFAVTRRPTAEWLAQQIVEAFPWDAAPTYLVRDNDGAYGQTFTNRVRAMGIRDRPISPRSPWQNPYVERLIGTFRRDCLDHVLIFGDDIAAGADVVVPGNPIRGRSRLKENQGNIICDACNPPSACDLRRRSVQTAAAAGSREPLSSSPVRGRWAARTIWRV